MTFLSSTVFLFFYSCLLKGLKEWSCSEIVEEYSREVRKLCQKLIEFIALGLGLKGDAFDEIFGVAVQAIRMNYYPACSRPDLVLGLSPHSDGSALTVLQQAKGSPMGLQILKDSTWVPVQPFPNSLVINIGDTIEVRPLYSSFCPLQFFSTTGLGDSQRELLGLHHDCNV